MTEQQEGATPTAPPDPAAQQETGGREAAGYRRKLRDTETKLGVTQSALTAARQDLLRNSIAPMRFDGRAFNLDAFDDADLDVDGLFDDAGKVDTAALEEAMTALFESRGYMFAEHGKGRLHVPGEGKIPTGDFQESQFEDAFKPGGGSDQ